MTETGLIPASTQALAQTDAFAEGWWQNRHQQKVQEIEYRQGQIDIAFLGDSITHAWEEKGRQTWHRYYANRRALNLGFNGDRTENLLWRLENSPLHLFSPKLSILLIGTNNIGHRKDTAQDVALGVQKILTHLSCVWPNSNVLLLAIFPRGKRPTNPLRKIVVAANSLLAPLADGKKVHWLDLSQLFLDENAVIQESIMLDMLHPNANQYQRWAEAMQSSIEQLV